MLKEKDVLLVDRTINTFINFNKINVTNCVIIVLNIYYNVMIIISKILECCLVVIRIQ